MKNKILIVCLVFLIPLVSALDNSLPIICGGNDKILIGCLNSQDLIFLGNAVPTNPGGQGGGITPEVPEEIPIVKPPVKVLPFFSIANLNAFLLSKGLGQLDIYILEIFIGGIFVCMLFLVFKKRKKKESASRSQSSQNKNLRHTEI